MLLNDLQLEPDIIERLVNHPELAKILAHLQHIRSIPNTDFQSNLPSSSARWSDVASKLGLPPDAAQIQLEDFSPPIRVLPPSLHVALFQQGWKAINVYGEKVEQNREVGRLKLLEPWLEPILAIFEGRITDRPAAKIPENELSSGRAVQHKIFVTGGFLLLVMEFKPADQDSTALAELFLELLSAAKSNAQVEQYANLRVFGLMTDMSTFKFFSYSPETKRFYHGPKLIANNKREDFCYDMITVSGIIFSIVFHGYCELVESMADPDALASDEECLYADALATAARNKFEQAEEASKERNFALVETLTQEALRSLQQSARCLQRLSGGLPSDLEYDVGRVARRKVAAWYEVRPDRHLVKSFS